MKANKRSQFVGIWLSAIASKGETCKYLYGAKIGSGLNLLDQKI